MRNHYARGAGRELFLLKIIFPPSCSTVEAVHRILCDVLRSLFEGQDQGAEVADLFPLAVMNRPPISLLRIASPSHPCLTTVCNHVSLKMGSRSGCICLLVFR